MSKISFGHRWTQAVTLAREQGASKACIPRQKLQSTHVAKWQPMSSKETRLPHLMGLCGKTDMLQEMDLQHVLTNTICLDIIKRCTTTSLGSTTEMLLCALQNPISHGRKLTASGTETASSLKGGWTKKDLRTRLLPTETYRISVQYHSRKGKLSAFCSHVDQDLTIILMAHLAAGKNPSLCVGHPPFSNFVPGLGLTSRNENFPTLALGVTCIQKEKQGCWNKGRPRIFFLPARSQYLNQGGSEKILQKLWAEFFSLESFWPGEFMSTEQAEMTIPGLCSGMDCYHCLGC